MDIGGLVWWELRAVRAERDLAEERLRAASVAFAAKFPKQPPWGDEWIILADTALVYAVAFRRVKETEAKIE